jgi:hypothetical protein
MSALFIALPIQTNLDFNQKPHIFIKTHKNPRSCTMNLFQFDIYILAWPDIINSNVKHIANN